MWTTNYHCHINMLLRWWGGLLVYFVYLQFCTSLPQLIHSAYSFLLRYAMPLIDKEFMPGTIVNWIEIHSSPLFWGRATFLLCLYTYTLLSDSSTMVLLSLAQQFWNGNVRWKVGAHISTTNSHTFWPKG